MIEEPEQPQYEDEEEKRGSIQDIMANLNAVAMQLDNSPILEKAKCRFLAGYFIKGDFRQWIDDDPNDERKPKMNERGWAVYEHFLDKNTCANEILSNKDEKTIRRLVWVESMALNEDLCHHQKEYGIDLDDVSFLVIEAASMAFSGQSRSIGGQTAKAINKVIKQIESIVNNGESQQKKGVLARMGLR